MNLKQLMEEVSKTMEPNFCKDCKFAKPTSWWELPFLFNRYRFGHCLHPIAGAQINSDDFYVTGKTPEPLYLSIARSDWRCGKEGKYWEDKNASV